MCDWGTETILPMPEWLCLDKQNRTVCIDSCIADKIKTLWAAKIVTLGCCCGHGKESPSVVIEASYRDYEKIKEIVPDWRILQWQLVEV